MILADYGTKGLWPVFSCGDDKFIHRHTFPEKISDMQYKQILLNFLLAITGVLGVLKNNASSIWDVF